LNLIRRLAFVAVLLAALLAPSRAGAATSQPHVVLVFLPRTLYKVYNPNNPTVLDRLNAEKSLALGLVSETQGGYNQTQALLDFTSGTRTSQTTYKPKNPPLLTFIPIRDTGVVYGFYSAVKRAETAPADIFPGLLASSIPGGAAYVGAQHVKNRVDADVAADEEGVVNYVSLGTSATIADRVKASLQTHRFVVVGLPQRQRGIDAMHRILQQRAPNDLVIVTQTPPAGKAGQLSPMGIAGLKTNGALTSETTHRHGIIAAIDVLPTVLKHLGIRIPKAVKGEPITTEGVRDASNLHALAKRLSVIGARRFPALEAIMFTWLAIVLALGVWRDRVGFRQGLRWGGLAIMWLPTSLLFTAWLNVHRTPELVVICVASFVLAAITDRFVRWPRAPAVPAIAGLVVYAVDLVQNSQLIVRSLLGPNPRSGSRFYGIGNELEITLTLLLLVGVAAVLRRRERSNRAAAIVAVWGIVAAAIIASGQLGADVGGVFTVGGGTAVAVLLLLPGGVTRRAVVLAIVAPFVGLALLALLDIATGGNGHFTRTILHANGISDLRKTLVRRSELAWNNLRHGLMPLIAAICLLAGAYAIRHRRRVYGVVSSDPVWVAGMGGAFAACIVGSLTNDSGPLLLLIGTVGLASVTAYLRGVEPVPPAPEGPVDSSPSPVAAAERPPPAEAAPEEEPVGQPR
jgi:hypothetical protein